MSFLARLKQFFSSEDPIKHVVVMMFENHSFDQMLGCFPEVEGVDPSRPGSNKDSKGVEYFQSPTFDPKVPTDPQHEVENVRIQLQGNNSGFVLNYEQVAKAPSSELQKIMDYYPLGSLSALHTLAQYFTICDKWHSSVPGRPTWTNRFFVHSGTSMGRVNMAETWHSNPLLYLGYNQDTIYDRLNEKGVQWRIYYGDVPQSLVLEHQRRLFSRPCYKVFEDFAVDARGPEHEFPAYTFIEPRYYHIPTKPQSDDHPPHLIVQAQLLLAEVYNALRGNEALWNSTLLVVLYDEHGGFYDHVVPPEAEPPDDHAEQYDFKQYGLRIPAVLVSPWVERRVVSTLFDHTSLLKYVIDKWHLRGLTKRDRAAISIAEAISVRGEARSDTPKFIPMPDLASVRAQIAAEQPVEPLNDNDLQRSLTDFTEYLESRTPLHAQPKMMAAGPHSDAILARERVAAFLAHGTEESK